MLHNDEINNLTCKLAYVSSKSVCGLRNNCNLVVNYSRTAIRHNAFPCSSVLVWNNLSIDIRRLVSVKLFKSTVTHQLLNCYFDS